MTNDNDVVTPPDPTPAPNKSLDELAVLSQVMGSLAPLDPAVRLRIFRTLMTFFEIPSGTGGSITSGPPRTPPGIESFSPATSPASPSVPSFSEDRAPTPKTFLLEKRPQTDVERVACLAYYLTHYRDQAYFKTLDLSKLNTEAAQVKFSNAAKAVDNATSAHFLIAAGQGKKQLSAIGELYVQALPDRAAARQAASEVRQRRRPKGKSSRSNGSNDAFESNGASGDNGH